MAAFLPIAADAEPAERGVRKVLPRPWPRATPVMNSAFFSVTVVASW